jgi:3-methyl-2-oxobutanoate hydroxymethyltransferase
MSDRFTTASFRLAKGDGKKISMLTAYDYPTAKLLDSAGVDAILVGDSMGMVVLGYEDTTKVTMEDMLHHIKAVARAAKRAMVIGDMPFLSYHLGEKESVRNAGRLIQEGGCTAIKLEGGEPVLGDVKAILHAGIPVMGHLGYTPQSINLFGGHKAQGKTLETAREILRDALLLQEAGVFAIVLECVPYKLAQFITERLDIPTIGIGAGPGCDGQVLVTPDMLGLFPELNLKHSKKYADLSALTQAAVQNYISDIQGGIFPTEKNSFRLDEEILQKVIENAIG